MKVEEGWRACSSVDLPEPVRPAGEAARISARASTRTRARARARTSTRASTRTRTLELKRQGSS